MKIIKGEVVYVQESDLGLLLKATKEEKIPKNVLNTVNEIIENEETSNPERYRLFSGEGVIPFFNSLDYILDENEANNMSWSETITAEFDLLQQLSTKQKDLIELIGSSDEEKITNLKNDIDLLKYQMTVYKKLMNEKKGQIVIYANKKRKIKAFNKSKKNK